MAACEARNAPGSDNGDSTGLKNSTWEIVGQLTSKPVTFDAIKLTCLRPTFPEILYMHVRCTLVFAASIAVLVTHPAAAQSKRGIWSGTSATQQGTQPFTIVLDSTASGWKGAAAAPSTTSDSLRLVEVSVRADTVEFGIPFNGVTVYVSGLVVGDKLSGELWMQNRSVGSVQLTHKTAPVDKPPPDSKQRGSVLLLMAGEQRSMSSKIQLPQRLEPEAHLIHQ